MNRIFSRAVMLLAVGVVLAGGLMVISPNSAQAAFARQSTAGDLFYNFYSPPVGYESVGAQLYPCPRPTPRWVGWTYITYQPLMPHEFLYRHKRVYRTKHIDAPNTPLACVGVR